MKKRTPISRIMTTNLVTIPVTEKLENAEKLFKENHIRHIPVVKDKEILGMLSYSDILKISFQNIPFEDEGQTYMNLPIHIGVLFWFYVI